MTVFIQGYQEALRDVKSRFDTDGPEAAEQWITDNLMPAPERIVHWTHEPTGVSGHAHQTCIPDDGEHVEVPLEEVREGDWAECLGKPGRCDWCGDYGQFDPAEDLAGIGAGHA